MRMRPSSDCSLSAIARVSSSPSMTYRISKSEPASAACNLRVSASMFSCSFQAAMTATIFKRRGSYRYSRRRARSHLLHRPGQRLEERDQVRLLLFREIQLVQQHGLRLLRAAAGVVEIDHLAERAE